MTTRLAILGSTGSIGRQALQVVDHLQGKFEVVALAAGHNTALLREQVARYRPRLVSVRSADVARELRALDPLYGPAGLRAIATMTEADMVLVATSGHAAIEPTLLAIQAGKTIALANKETIVCAGEIITREARARNVQIRPVDSEHSALWQCLGAPHQPDEVESVTLTASGGALLNMPLTELHRVTVERALAHPNWSMGNKITIDSATMMNKGLEVIEAHWLFELPLDRIEIVVHPQSLVHALVSFVDGSVIANLAVHDMRVPIQYALTYPTRRPAPQLRLNIAQLGRLEFLPLDLERYPAVSLARQAARAGGTYPTVLSAADDLAVELFLGGVIRFSQITELVGRVLERHQCPSGALSLDAIEAADAWARDETRQIASSLDPP